MDNRKFESKSIIIGNLILQTVAVIMGGYVVMDILLKSDLEFEQFIDQYSNGTGSTRSIRSIVYIIYKYSGRIGCLIIFSLIAGGILLIWIKEFNSLRRYLHKEKLFKMGMVSDMDDDYKPESLFKSLRNLVHKDFGNQKKVKTYSRKELKEMKKKLSDIEKGKRRRSNK